MGKLDQPSAVGRTVRLGIRTNLAQFSLLVGVNALVGGMVGQERTLLPLMARRIFHLQAFTAVLTFLVAFGLVKAGGLGAGMWSPFTVRKSPTCTVPTLPGETVHVVLSDTGGMMGGGMMGGGHMMSVATSPSVIASGDVRFAVWNAGMMVHELVVLPLPPGGTGTRPVALDGRVSEEGSLGEGSRSCTERAGDGIAPGAVGMATVHLAAGRYELVCNQPGHYAMGMFTELDAL